MNLNQITVPSVDLEKAIPFYQKLGLQLIVEALPHYARFEYPEGDATFSIHRVNEWPSGDGVYVYFECSDLDEHVNALVEKGVAVEELPNDKNWKWREARLKDVDNNQIILFFGGVNRKNPPWCI